MTLHSQALNDRGMKRMDSKKRVFTVLVIDGGGVRGIVPARILQEIEERTGKPVSELFDLVAGASTGAIVAAGLVIPDPADPSKPRFSDVALLKFVNDGDAEMINALLYAIHKVNPLVKN